MMTRQRLQWIIIALATVVFAGGCGKMATHKIADGIKTALPTVVGPADSWDVTVTGNEGTIIGGRIPSVSIRGVNVHVTPQMTMAALDIDAKDIAIDVRQRTVKSVGSLAFEGHISQSGLDRYMALNAANNPNGVKDPRIDLRRDDLLLKFKHVEMGVGIPVSVAGRVYVNRASDSKIDFHATSASVARIGIPRAVYNYEIDKLNPVIDLSTMALPIHLKNIHVQDKEIVFSGTTEITKAAIDEAKRQADNAK